MPLANKHHTWLLSLLCCGCELIIGYQASSRPPSDGPGSRVEAGAGQEGGVGVDLAGLFADAPSADATGSGTFESGVFVDVLAGSLDQGSNSACSAGPGTVIATDVVVCDTPSTDPCGAPAFCAAGWKICAASVYRSRVTTAPPSSFAWVGGFIRDGAGVVQPTDGTVSNCNSGATAAPEYYLWSCTSATNAGTTTIPYLAIATSTGCNRIGANTPATAGFWGILSARVTLSKVVCCR